MQLSPTHQASGSAIGRFVDNPESFPPCVAFGLLSSPPDMDGKAASEPVGTPGYSRVWCELTSVGPRTGAIRNQTAIELLFQSGGPEALWWAAFPDLEATDYIAYGRLSPVGLTRDHQRLLIDVDALTLTVRPEGAVGVSRPVLPLEGASA